MDTATLNIALNLVGVLLGGTALGVILRFMNRRQELHNADVSDIRDHYADEVKALRESNIALEKHFREMLADSDRRHQECQEDRERMREEWRKDREVRDEKIRSLEDHIEGLERKILALSDDRLLELTTAKAPVAFETAPRAKEHRENGDK